MLKKTLIACAAGALLVAPGASAKPNPERMNAAKECRAAEETGKDFGKCVREKVRERKAMRTNAAEECRTERSQGPDAFRDRGTNGNQRNAFGKCVSSKVKQMKASDDTEKTS